MDTVEPDSQEIVMNWRLLIPAALTGSLATIMIDRWMWTPEWTGFPGPTPVVLVAAIVITALLAVR